MSNFYEHMNDKQSGHGLAITDWNKLSNAVAGNQGLHLALDATNNVGIGTTSPSAKLHISETTGTTHSANDGTLILDHENSGGASSIVFRSKKNRGSDYGYIQYQDDSSIGGTGESARLIIGTSNDAADDLILSPTGNVGIGTDNPTTKLHLETGKLRVRNVDNSAASDIGAFYAENLTQGIGIGYNTIGAVGTNPDQDILIMPKGSGNVGIGTTNPETILNIVRENDPRLRITGSDQSDTAGIELLEYNNQNAQYGFGLIYDGTVANNVFKIQRFNNGDTQDALSILRSNGYVSIGTNDPDHKLEVNGRVKATHFVGDGSELTNLSVGLNGLNLATEGGNVGIGTTIPEAKLHISSSTGDAILRLEADTDNDNESDNPKIELRQDRGQIGVNIGFDEDNFGQNRFGISGRSSNNNYYDTFIIDTEDGNVGIGTTNPQSKLDVYGHIRLSAANDQHSILKCEDNGFKIFLKDGRGSNNDRTATWDGDSNWDYSSDKKLKTNILDEKNILERLIQLNVKNYNWKDKPDQNPKPIGFIAQDVKPLFPYVASESVNEETKETSPTLKYNSFGVLAVGAIKELNDKFESALEKLTKKVDVLAKKVK